MPFEVDEHVPAALSARSTPGGDGNRESSEQPVVHRASEMLRHRRDDVLGHGGRNVDADSVDGGSDIDGWVEPACPEQWLVGPHSRPQVDLVASQRSGLGERCRPATYRRSARRKYGCFSVERRGISSDQARDEHAPGHTVDREVMKDQEQPSGFGPVAVRADGIQPDCADHLPVFGIEAAGCVLHRGFRSGDEFFAAGGHDGGSAQDVGGGDAPWLADLELVSRGVQARPQHVVTIEDRLQCSFQRGAGDIRGQCDQRALAVTADRAQVTATAFDEPLHDRRER